MAPRRRRAFTLIEILVVIAIILITSLIALPLINSALKGGDATGAATTLQGALAGARDAAIRENQPRGLRLMPDPLLTIPALGMAGAGKRQLAFNRLVPIEPAPDYSMGKISIGPMPNVTALAAMTWPPPHPITSGAFYPFPNVAGIPRVLMVEESPIQGGFKSPSPHVPNEPVNWWWNIRVGDKLKFNDTGRSYTVIGPCTINPNAPLAANVGNPEMFCNIGAPGTKSPLTRTYYDQLSGNPITGIPAPEFLFLVNGEDDDKDGWADPGWDGYDGTKNAAGNMIPDGVVDDASEWIETEEWKGALTTNTLIDTDPTATGQTPSPFWVANSFASGLHDVSYSISRRPVPSPGAREVLLPPGVVIDATTWNLPGLTERSRLPVQQGALTVDIMVNPSGLYIPTTQYSTPTSMGAAPFLHFWLSSRDDVFPDGSIWQDASGNPAPNPNAGQTYRLPMSEGTPGYPPAGSSVPNPPVLKNDRRLVTLYTQTGMVVTNLIENVPPPSAYLKGEGFNVGDVNYPFYHAQMGRREVR